MVMVLWPGLHGAWSRLHHFDRREGSTGDVLHRSPLASLSFVFITPTFAVLFMSTVPMCRQVWDAGFGFGLGTLYRTAYFAMALTASVVAYFVFFL